MSLKDLAKKVRAEGRGKDDQLVHLTSREVAGLHQLAEAAGGKLTTNPKTGLPEAGFLDSMLPTILGFAANFVVPGSGMYVGAATGALQNKDDPLMGAVLGGMGGYGGGQLGAGLQGMGASAAQAAATPAAQAAGVTATEAAKAGAGNAVGQGLQAVGGEGLQMASNFGLQATPSNIGTQLAASQPMSYQSALSPVELEGARNAAMGAEYTAASDRFMAQPWQDRMLQSVKAPFADQGGGLGALTREMGGGMNTAKAAGMAAAPMIYDSMIPKPMGGEEDSGPGELPKYKYAANQTGDYYGAGGDYGTHERNYFTQPTFQRMAGGGIAGLAKGGPVHMESGDFVIPADVTAYAGGGSTEAGMEALSKKLGAVPIRGAGDGLSDDIPATIDGKPMARVANGEMLVKQPGKEGTKKLYAALAKIRKQATGRSQQIKPVDLDKALA